MSKFRALQLSSIRGGDSVFGKLGLRGYAKNCVTQTTRSKIFFVSYPRFRLISITCSFEFLNSAALACIPGVPNLFVAVYHLRSYSVTACHLTLTISFVHKRTVRMG